MSYVAEKSRNVSAANETTPTMYLTVGAGVAVFASKVGAETYETKTSHVIPVVLLLRTA